MTRGLIGETLSFVLSFLIYLPEQLNHKIVLNLSLYPYHNGTNEQGCKEIIHCRFRNSIFFFCNFL